MSKARTPRTPLTIYRLKPAPKGAGPFTGIVDEKPGDVTELDAQIPDADARLYVKNVDPSLPGWASFLKPISDLDGALGEHAANSAVLVVVVRRLRYAFVFGYGRSMLASDVIERGFGLRCALDLIDPSSIVSVGYKEVDHRTLFSNVQSNANVAFDAFRVDTESAIMSGVVGHAADAHTYYTRALGSDALHINPQVTAAEIPKLVTWVDQVYIAKRYISAGYDWVDHVSLVNDPAITAALEKLIDADLKRGKKNVWLAPPEAVDYGRIDAFTVEGMRGREISEVELADVASARSEDITCAELRKVRIKALSSHEEIQRWKAYAWLNWSGSTANGSYVLQAGRFYRIDPNFEDRIDKYLKKLGKLPDDWPDWLSAEDAPEEVYNERLAKHLGSAGVVFDKVKFNKSFRGHGELEFCDVLVKKKPPVLVCVKKYKGGSAPLSHLFAQGLNAVETLLADSGFREEVRECGKKGIKSYIRDAPSGRYVLAFLILAKPHRGKRKPLWRLPFFAKLTLYRTAKAANLRGISTLAGTRQWTV